MKYDAVSIYCAIKIPVITIVYCNQILVNDLPDLVNLRQSNSFA